MLSVRKGIQSILGHVIKERFRTGIDVLRACESLKACSDVLLDNASQTQAATPKNN